MCRILLTLCRAADISIRHERVEQEAYVHIEGWRNRLLHGVRYPHVYGIDLHRNWGKKYENIAISIAVTANADR